MTEQKKKMLRRILSKIRRSIWFQLFVNIISGLVAAWLAKILFT